MSKTIERSIKVRHSRLAKISLPPINLKVHFGDTRVMITELRTRTDLNTRVGLICGDQQGDGRWVVNLKHQAIAVKTKNLTPLPHAPTLGMATTPAALHCQDLVRIRLAAEFGVGVHAFADDREDLLANALLRQQMLCTWGEFPTDPLACINVAIAPTLVYGMLASRPHIKAEGTLKVHCIGATADFEGCADWSGLSQLLAAADFNPSNVEITHFGNENCFSLPPDCMKWSDMRMSSQPQKQQIPVKVEYVRELYHQRERPRPDVAVLCHPGFDNYLKMWLPTMEVLLRGHIPVVVSSHSNFYAFTTDSILHQDIALGAIGAKIIQRQIWNPFCLAYHDPTKGSLLAPPGKDEVHCNLACISIVQGGSCNAIQDVDEFLECLDYLSVGTSAFPSSVAAGPLHRNTDLRWKYPNMKMSERAAACNLARDLTQGIRAPPLTASAFKDMFKEYDLFGHFARGRGKW